MGRGGYRKGNPALNRDTAIKAHQLKRNLPLIMIHGDDAIYLACLGFQKDSVRWPGPVHIDLFCL